MMAFKQQIDLPTTTATATANNNDNNIAATSKTTTTTTSRGRQRNKRLISKSGTCGLPWKQYLASFVFPNNNNSGSRAASALPLPLVWSISGGAEYRSYVGDLIHHWHTIEPDISFLLVALDPETASVACALGYDAVYWDAPAQSYSRVADAKMQVAVEWIDRGIDALFVEMDVLCRWSPIRLFQERAYQTNASLVWVGHGKVSFQINIGAYFVRANHNPGVREFFQEVSQVLAPSRDEAQYLKDDGNIRDYFDQEAFAFCLQERDKPIRPRWYRLTDVNQTYDLFTPCQRHASFIHTSLSTMLITNEDPPVAHDSTYCVHPLVGSPFSSFRYKLLLAKLVGFDPIEWRPDEKFLKTQSGGLSEFMWLLWDGFHNSTSNHVPFKNAVAALILLSQLSNRTLVLPRHVLCKEFQSLPVYGFVDVTTIEDIVPWRFLQQSDVHPHKNETVEISAEPYHSSNFASIVEAVQRCEGRFCAIRDLGTINRWHPWQKDLNDVISKVKWCVQQTEMKPAHGFGSYEMPCRPWIHDKE
jgi:hypothetical protein